MLHAVQTQLHGAVDGLVVGQVGAGLLVGSVGDPDNSGHFLIGHLHIVKALFGAGHTASIHHLDLVCAQSALSAGGFHKFINASTLDMAVILTAMAGVRNEGLTAGDEIRAHKHMHF